ncbi:MAG TPA: YbdK family carboxylate-amine ligase [Tepidisphaeraceae bacterium]|jgi:carboxylate-amine ligase
MRGLKFVPSSKPTLGVEVELALVDQNTMALASAAPSLLSRLPEALRQWVKPELMQCYVEINTEVCPTVAHAEADLRGKLAPLQRAADETGVRLYWSATHPFSTWREQQVTDNDRYNWLINSLQDTARQMITFGLHVHVGVDSGDKAVMICDRMLRYLPILLAASCNSPFWDGRVTGLQSWRARVVEGLPTAGLPPLMRNWSEYVWLITHLIDTGYIQTIREIWWDIRPHHNFGTVEVRVCDVPGCLDDTMTLVALIHCLVAKLSDEIDEGTYQHDSHPMIVRQNKWHAARYGLEASLVDFDTHKIKPVRQTLKDLAEQLHPVAERLACSTYLEKLPALADQPTWAQRQLDLLKEHGDAKKMVATLTENCRVSG